MIITIMITQVITTTMTTIIIITDEVKPGHPFRE